MGLVGMTKVVERTEFVAMMDSMEGMRLEEMAKRAIRRDRKKEWRGENRGAGL